MAAGGGELTAVVTQTSSFLGLLNPFSWFAKPQAAPPAGGLPAAREARAELEPTPPTDHAMAAPKVVVGTSYGELRPWRAAPAGFDRSVHAKPKLMVGTIAAIEQQKYHDEADGPMAA